MFDRENNISGENPKHIHFVKNVAKPLFESWGYKVFILHSEGDKCENYIPVSIAKRIVKARGLGGVFGYTKDN